MTAVGLPNACATAADSVPTDTLRSAEGSAPLTGTCAPMAGHRDRAARNALALEFMPLARRIARDYHTPRDQEDLEQVAYVALLKAIDRFEPERGSSFAAYAGPTIAGEIKNYLRDHSWDIHVPRRLQDRALRARRVRSELCAELRRPPRIEEMAARLDSDPDSVLDALTAADARDATSFDQETDRDNPHGPTLADVVMRGIEDQGFERAIERAALRDALSPLSTQERQVLGLRFLYDLSQSDIAARLGVSQMQVSRLLRRALERTVRGEADQGNEDGRHGPARLVGHPANPSVWSAGVRGTADSVLRSQHQHLTTSQ